MGQETVSFSDFITDKDGDYTEAQFISLATKLLQEGRRPERVFKAILRAGYKASAQHSVLEHRNFVVWAAEDTADYAKQVEKFCDKMIEEHERAN